MEHSTDLEIANWLISAESADWFDWLTEQDLRAISTVSKLRKQLSPKQVDALISQVNLRGRAKRKFPLAETMYFSEIALQQATDLEIASYKALRFSHEEPIADMCCGIGGDLIALAKNSPTTAVDLSDVHLLFAKTNARINGCQQVETICNFAEKVPLESFAAWHIDPDRRSQAKRTTHLDYFSPALPELEAMLTKNQNAAFKLAPATDVPESWHPQCELEWISHHRECKQLVVWHGSLALHGGTCCATRIDANGNPHSHQGVPSGISEIRPPMQFIYDPDPALVASGLVDHLAQNLDLGRLSPKSHYLTGTEAVEHPLLQSFRLEEAEKIDVKRLKKIVASSEMGRLELKQRGVQLDLDQFRKKLKPNGAGEGAILFTPTTNGNQALVCRRLTE